MKIVPVPCRSDNYEYLIIDEATQTTAVVDPYDPPKLQKAAEKEGVQLGQYLLTTHGHHDHAGGNEKTKELYPNIKVYAGGSNVSAATDVLSDGDKFKIGSLDVTAINTPCHTRDHICYFVEDKEKDQRAVFTGDTLFVAGCGRFFDGVPQEMDVALNEKLAALPADTVTYVGHEYTASNVAFCKKIEPENEAVLRLEKYCKENEVTTGKFTIGDEKEHNVFMRVTHPDVQKATGATDRVEVMGILRELKNKG
ncbi:hypothetical protein JCM8097_002609 [Rhodosporidiobolus ruineniae]